MAEVVQQVEGGKWHRVWWSKAMETSGTVLTHVAAYRADRHPRQPEESVAQRDLCRICYPRGR